MVEGDLSNPRFTIAIIDHRELGAISRRVGDWPSARSGRRRETRSGSRRERRVFPQTLFAVDLAGRTRELLRIPPTALLEDVSRDGLALVKRQDSRSGILCRPPGETVERELSWFDYSNVASISRDGKVILFTERGGGTAKNTVYVRKTDASPAVRLGEGQAHALSPDAKWALTEGTDAPSRILLLPIGAGQPAPSTSPRWNLELRRLVARRGPAVLLGSRAGRNAGPSGADAVDWPAAPDRLRERTPRRPSLSGRHESRRVRGTCLEVCGLSLGRWASSSHPGTEGKSSRPRLGAGWPFDLRKKRLILGKDLSRSSGRWALRALEGASACRRGRSLRD